MRTVDFFEKPMEDKPKGYYYGREIERPTYIWHMYRELENKGVVFHIVMFGEEAAHLEARTYDDQNFYYKEYVKCDSKLGESVDEFIKNTKANYEAGTIIVKDLDNENNISESDQLPQLQGDQLDASSDGTVPDRREESGDGPSEHDREDNPTGLDSMDLVRLPS
jgi:hypothetical protein